MKQDTSKKDFRFSHILDNNRVVRIVSIIIAVIAWLIVSVTIDNNQIAKFDHIPLTIDMKNSAPAAYKLSIIDGAKQTVSVKVEGVRYKIGNLTKDSFVATPVLSSVTKSGTQDVKVEVHKADTTDNSYQIIAYTGSVKMTFDRVNEKILDVTPIADKVTAASGYRKDQVTAEPKQITLSGPQQELDLINKCNLEYDGDETAKETIVTNGTLVFYDKNNDKLVKSQISHVSYDQQQYTITIPIFMQKTVPVKVNFINSDGVDTSKLSYELSTNRLQIAGPSDIIEKRQDVTIGPIDLSKVDLGSSFTFDVSLDAGIINENDVNQITVYMKTDDMAKKSMTINKDNILLKNVPSGISAQVLSDNIKNVTLVGKKSDISSLSSKELVAWADVQNVAAGTSRVHVSVYTTGNKLVWALGDYYVMLQAAKK